MLEKKGLVGMKPVVEEQHVDINSVDHQVVAEATLVFVSIV